MATVNDLSGNLAARSDWIVSAIGYDLPVGTLKIKILYYGEEEGWEE